jgi:hypothetical protein
VRRIVVAWWRTTSTPSTTPKAVTPAHVTATAPPSRTTSSTTGRTAPGAPRPLDAGTAPCHARLVVLTLLIVAVVGLDTSP